MSVSKALRFQILRRDGHMCHYCGGRPPGVTLVVDHVLPVTLGGADSADNLITSCADCNAGKGATPPDANNVAEVDERNEQWAAAVAEAAAIGAADDHSWFVEYWNCWETRGQPVPMDVNWRSAIDVWTGRGLTHAVILDNVERAMTKLGLRNRDVFRYFAGCCWRSVTELEQQAAQIIERKRAR